LGEIIDQGDGTWVWAFDSDDGPAESQTVTVTATDSDGAETSATFELVVNNVAPTALFLSEGPVAQATEPIVGFQFQSDPSVADTEAGFRYAYDWDSNGRFDYGDGAYAGSSETAWRRVPLQYAMGPGTIEVTGRIIDKDEGHREYRLEIELMGDRDGDGIPDAEDPCPTDPTNLDTDGDGVCEGDDNCWDTYNPEQADADGDGLGDLCDPCPLDAANDADGDGVCGDLDNCPDVANPSQADGDGDGIGDACEEGWTLMLPAIFKP
jgi:hypothetical protein